MPSFIDSVALCYNFICQTWIFCLLDVLQYVGQDSIGLSNVIRMCCFKGSLEIILHIPLPFLCLPERHINLIGYRICSGSGEKNAQDT
jgi:hypothetical protein